MSRGTQAEILAVLRDRIAQDGAPDESVRQWVAQELAGMRIAGPLQFGGSTPTRYAAHGPVGFIHVESQPGALVFRWSLSALAVDGQEEIRPGHGGTGYVSHMEADAGLCAMLERLGWHCVDSTAITEAQIEGWRSMLSEALGEDVEAFAESGCVLLRVWEEMEVDGEPQCRFMQRIRFGEPTEKAAMALAEEIRIRRRHPATGAAAALDRQDSR